MNKTSGETHIEIQEMHEAQKTCEKHIKVHRQKHVENIHNAEGITDTKHKNVRGITDKNM